jgi:hypothetical protein
VNAKEFIDSLDRELEPLRGELVNSKYVQNLISGGYNMKQFIELMKQRHAFIRENPYIIASWIWIQACPDRETRDMFIDYLHEETPHPEYLIGLGGILLTSRARSRSSLKETARSRVSKRPGASFAGSRSTNSTTPSSLSTVTTPQPSPMPHVRRCAHEAQRKMTRAHGLKHSASLKLGHGLCDVLVSCTRIGISS